MKKRVLILLPLTLLLGLSALVLFTVKKYNGHRLSMERIAKLPGFTFMTMDDEAFGSSGIGKGPLAIIYFHPECDHCRYEVSQLRDHVDLFRGIKILLISAGVREATKGLITELNLSLNSNFMVLLDKDVKFQEIFGNFPVPSHFLYDKNLELIKVIPGECRDETILKFLHQDEY